jgi:hypothetical protein
MPKAKAKTKPTTWSDPRRARDVSEATITACRPPQNDRLTRSEVWAIERHRAGLGLADIAAGSGIPVRRLVVLLGLENDLSEREIATLETNQRTLSLGKGFEEDERFASCRRGGY